MSHRLNPPVTRRPFVRVVDEAEVDTIEMELRPEDLARLAQISGGDALTKGSAEDAPAAQAANVERARVQSIQAELACGLAPRPTEAPPPSPSAPAPASDERAAAAKNAPVLVTDEAQISKPATLSHPPAPASTARVVPISTVREPRSSMPEAPSTAAPPVVATPTIQAPTSSPLTPTTQELPASAPPTPSTQAAPVSATATTQELPVLVLPTPSTQAAPVSATSITQELPALVLPTPSVQTPTSSPMPAMKEPLVLAPIMKGPLVSALPTPSMTGPGASSSPPPVRGTLVVVPPRAEAPAAQTSAASSAPNDGPRGVRWLGAAVLGLFAIGAATIWLSSLASFQPDDPPPPAPVAAIEPEPVSTPATTAIAAAPAAIPPGELVKFRNPFDAAEVFEFPVGTSRTDARDAVAQFLLQRACERGRRPATTSTAESPCGQAATPADLLSSTASGEP